MVGVWNVERERKREREKGVSPDGKDSTFPWKSTTPSNYQKTQWEEGEDDPRIKRGNT